jgi:hypothetical protein
LYNELVKGSLGDATVATPVFGRLKLNNDGAELVGVGLCFLFSGDGRSAAFIGDKGLLGCN